MSNFMRLNPILAYKMTTTIDNKLLCDVHDEDEILELDADKVALVADTFGKVQMYLKSDTKRGYVKLNAPGLYSFQMPEHPHGDPESITHNEDDDSKLIDSWTNESMEEINLIKKDDEALLGSIQRDEVTGEIYILMPLEMDVLLQSEFPIDSTEQPRALAASDSTMTITDIVDEENASQTTLTDNTLPAIPLQGEEAGMGILCEYEVCRLVVPQLSLNFKLTLQVGEPNEDEVDASDIDDGDYNNNDADDADDADNEIDEDNDEDDDDDDDEDDDDDDDINNDNNNDNGNDDDEDYKED
ncbi:uncharacterized protein LOC111596593 [Drosophila hydei]|uniref:Uncharacterized protein LOC111596593 n=1 Tax=Drosophila hydei TaxID=7224 RepID=A0A6J1LS97_DROHY|nr:uncharacterized protein LOC111596593 [Drosophila hydei]